MRHIPLIASFALACSGCVATPPPEAVVPAASVVNATMTISPGNPACRDYTAQVAIDGRAQQVVGHACHLPDGSWRVAEGTPEQPNRIVLLYPAATYPDYAYAPWFWGPSIGLGFGAQVFVGHPHRFHNFARFHHDGFRHFGGFHQFGSFHGFHGGFSHGGEMAHGGMRRP